MAKEILIFILRILARLTLWRYKPFIVGVTGSVGKTSAKEAIFSVLKKKFNTQRNYKNYNNEIGVPLTIIGMESGQSSPLRWLLVFIKGLIGIIRTKNYPKILVLEMGADKIGDIGYLTSFVPCQVGGVTAIGGIAVHVEVFQAPEHVVIETGMESGMVDLNHSLLELVRSGEISMESAYQYSLHPKALERML